MRISKKLSLSVLLVVAAISFALWFKQNHKKPVLALPSTGTLEADELLLKDLAPLDLMLTVSPSSPGEVPLNLSLPEFIGLVQQWLSCPENCDIYVACNDHPQDALLETCTIEWSKKINDPQPGQDSEPQSIWTLMYSRSKEDGRVLKESVDAYWKDF